MSGFTVTRIQTGTEASAAGIGDGDVQIPFEEWGSHSGGQWA